MQVYDIALAPGQSRQIHVQADYIYFLNGNAGGGDPTIEFRPHSGAETVYLKPGQAYKLPASARGMGITWVMANLRGDGVIVGQVLMGEGEFQDNRVSGSVEVIDGGRSRTMANQAFDGSVYASPQANLFPVVQLYNPASSNRRLIIKRISGATAAGGSMGIVIVPGTIGAMVSNVASKYSGGAASKSELRAANMAAPPAFQGLSSIAVPAGVSVDRVYQEPIVIQPSYGLAVYTNAKGVEAVGAFEFCEEAM